ncbi:acetyl-coenzyme A synthetase N-terminal domain-containing protein, partial [Pseudogemmobacter humi]|uniref:acetyl-coenzyme A synthetase N-terminal domain-containing protein n=1 Tax=Pseudogemmobacter humi TaxID=2483812 RepID=UPI0025B72D92
MKDQPDSRGMYPPSPSFVMSAHIDASGYASLYGESVSSADGFWFREGQRLDWIRPYASVKETSFAPGN